MSYNNIKSEFIKKELKRTKWKDSEYIDELMKIERFALGEVFGMVTPHLRSYLIRKYPKQWKIIYLELNPKQYKRILEDKKKAAEEEKREEKHFKQEEKLELKRDREAWKKMGRKLK